MTLGERIAQNRKALKISQEELGARLGVSRQAVSKWETNAATPDMANLIALAQEFGISVAELTETAEEPAREVMKQETAEKEGRSWPLALLIFILLGMAALALFLLSKAQTPVPQLESTPLPETEFYLYRHVYEDGSYREEALALGPQETSFPFGTSLSPTAPEEVLDTDFSSMKHHRVVCGGITVEYNRIEGEDGARDVVTSLSTIDPSFVTPRGIFSGETKDDLTLVYDDLVYCFKEEGYTLVPHDEYYVYSVFEEDLGYSSILFYMEDGLVVGLRLELMQDAGDAYAPDNLSRFPVKDGEPDFSLRQEPEREVLDDTRRVYVAFNQLVTNNNLSAEELYAYRRDIFTLLEDMNWTELGLMGAAEYPDDTIFALLHWLKTQDAYTASDILCIQRGCTADGLDGAYADAYYGLLSQVFFYDPAAFAGNLASGSIPEEIKPYVMRFTAYDAELYPAELEAALETLDGALSDGRFTEAEAEWARLLRLYLVTPLEERYELPVAPE